MERLKELLASARGIDIAMAWIGSGQPADALLAFAGNKPNLVRVISGVHGFMTDPATLAQLNSVSRLRIAYGTAGTKFHTKLMIFHMEDGPVAWIGSANLTSSAYSRNRELMCEVSDMFVKELFERYWQEFEANQPDEEWLEQYARLCRSIPAKKAVPQLLPPLRGPLPNWSWAEYVSALKSRNEKRMNWIADHIPIVRQIAYSNWSTLSKADAEKLLGIAPGFGGLGRLGTAGRVKKIFFRLTDETLATRAKIADALNTVGDDPFDRQFIPNLRAAIGQMLEIKGVSIGTMSRLLAVRHPDLFISVNGESRDILSKLCGIPSNKLNSVTGYVQLTEWMVRQKWWLAERPAVDAVIWEQRAALIDILTYRGRPREDMDKEGPYDGMDE